VEGWVGLRAEYRNHTVTVSSPVAVLMPSARGPGLCAYMLLQFLLGRHNQFLEDYCKLTKQRSVLK
jgi:hypothetical protein